MKKVILIIFSVVIILICLILYNLNSKPSKVKNIKYSSEQSNTTEEEISPLPDVTITADTKVHEETEAQTTEGYTPEEQTIYTDYSTANFRDYLNDGSHDYSRGNNVDYWLSMVTNDNRSVELLTTDNIAEVVKRLMEGYTHCIFCTNNFNDKYSGAFFKDVDYVAIGSIDLTNELINVSLISGNEKLRFKIKYTIVDNLIDDFEFIDRKEN